MFKVCTKFHENTFDSFNVIEGTKSPYLKVTIVDTTASLKLQKGMIPFNIMGGYMVLVLYTPSDDGSFCTTVCKNIFNGFRVIEPTRFLG